MFLEQKETSLILMDPSHLTTDSFVTPNRLSSPTAPHRVSFLCPGTILPEISNPILVPVVATAPLELSLMTPTTFVSLFIKLSPPSKDLQFGGWDRLAGHLSQSLYSRGLRAVLESQILSMSGPVL